MKITKQQLQKMIKEVVVETIQQEAPKPKRQQPIAYVKYSLHIPVYSHELPLASTRKSANRAAEIALASELKINKMDNAALHLSLEYEEVVGYDDV